MDSTAVPLVIAFLGIVGTLVSGLMTQRLAEMAKSKELDHSDRQRAEERQYERKRALAEVVRACYVKLNTASLGYHSELNHFWHALRAGRVTDDVLAAVDKVHRGLNRMYGVLKRLDSGIPPHREGESLEQVHTQIVAFWNQLAEMRQIMRRSIGAPPPILVIPTEDKL
ncbi:hypothetical protein [Streptomyces sirii]|uniref:hypothetical protein n=1 Tax=Streptomyces sirii TaxID=3127701 RepID=UPI003D35E0EB